MARDRLGSDYSENMSNGTTTCSCMNGSVDKHCWSGGGHFFKNGFHNTRANECSARGGMFQEPFFLHPPGPRPRDGGVYINPLSSRSPGPAAAAAAPRLKDGATSNGTGHGVESFYLHSPGGVVYTRIAHLFEAGGAGAASGPPGPAERRHSGASCSSSSGRSSASERKDETLTVKVDVHINNGTLKSTSNGSAALARSEAQGVAAARTTPPPAPPPPPSSAKDGSGSEHAYEQICIRQDERGSPKYIGPRRRLADSGGSDCSGSRKADRRYSRCSSASESSNLSSEIHCYSSTTSTPSLSRNSSNERMSKSPKVPPDGLSERKNSATSSTRAESEKETRTALSGPSIFRPPPPPPPPPPELDEVVIVQPSKLVESIGVGTGNSSNSSSSGGSGSSSNSSTAVREEKNKGASQPSCTRDQKCEATVTAVSAANKSATAPREDSPPPPPPPLLPLPLPPLASATSCSGGEGAEPPAATPAVGSRPPTTAAACAGDEEEPPSRPTAARGPSPPSTTRTRLQSAGSAGCQVTAHLVNRHMVLPFIPPQFASRAADSETLLKPSEYLRSICKAAPPGGSSSLSKARSVDNLDIQGRGGCEEESERKNESEEVTERAATAGPPPPPLPPPPVVACGTLPSSAIEPAAKQNQQQQQQQQQQQPLATISIQDLTSVQLRRTNNKMQATKTFSAPPNRSVSMTNVSEAFYVQKTDLIAELKKTKDIPGIKKLKVQRAQVEKSQEQNLISEINKTFSISKFVDHIPEKDSSGNIIPIWKRQMLARKAAERAKKELEEQIARENEEKRQKAIPSWKRQLLAKKDSDVKITGSALSHSNSVVVTITSPKIEVPIVAKKDSSLEIPAAPPLVTIVTVPSVQCKPAEDQVKTVVPIQPDLNNESDSVHIIPWRAQLRKTNSKLNILD